MKLELELKDRFDLNLIYSALNALRNYGMKSLQSLDKPTDELERLDELSKQIMEKLK
jgi:hypothetical protein